jgi:NAD(P)H-nitrite reductase large subunit
MTEDRNELICICMDVRKITIEDAVRNKNLTSIEEIGTATEAGTNCGACHEDLQEILEKVNGA